jgi:pyruvate/2-oxoglutarate dehydrogenase complex dihydrolipoamide dehydrogenase (E3) component
MVQVAAYVRRAIADVYTYETPAALAEKGIEFVAGSAAFLDQRNVRVGDAVLSARRFLICTGARAVIPPVSGLTDVPFLTYERFFENERLPAHLLIIGSGPIALEMAVAYRRLGAEVSVVGRRILPREDDDVRAFVTDMLHRERIRVIEGAATGASYRRGVVIVRAGDQMVEGDMLLVAAGRRPYVDGLAPERAGVACTPAGIGVDRFLRTSAPHIYAAGDAAGGYQFTHFAGWQAFLAVRNALLPGRAAAVTDVVPRVTFLDPEVAHVGMSDREAQLRNGRGVRVHRFDMARADRAVAEDEATGFIKLVTTAKGRILGATVVAAHAGEVIAEYALAIQRKLKVSDVARTIHPYPTWSLPCSRLPLT